jgi:hypothetical protein
MHKKIGFTFALALMLACFAAPIAACPQMQECFASQGHNCEQIVCETTVTSHYGGYNVGYAGFDIVRPGFALFIFCWEWIIILIGSFIFLGALCWSGGNNLFGQTAYYGGNRVCGPSGEVFVAGGY